MPETLDFSQGDMFPLYQFVILFSFERLYHECQASTVDKTSFVFNLFILHM